MSGGPGRSRSKCHQVGPVQSNCPFYNCQMGRLCQKVLRLPSGLRSVALLRCLGSTPEQQAKAEKIFLLSDTKNCPFGHGHRNFGAANPLLNFYVVEDASKMLPGFLENIPIVFKYLAKELGDDPYFCGDLTYADFCIFHFMDNIRTLDGGYTLSQMDDDAEKEKLEKFYNRMRDIDSVKRYLQERPRPGTQQVGNPAGSIIYAIKNPPEDVVAIRDFVRGRAK
mmetsp:Transcript_50683/g.93701  ORF Transcript_50683/g.93701 Transcript_50683/m.93701 type:complete len:224 (-) Transcript_50683:302-973(-)